MGTRADFYVGRGGDAEWLGSIAWDGYSIDEAVACAPTEEGFRSAVNAFLVERDDATLPAYGWPWPWDDSRTTDFAYAFDAGRVWVACFGKGWFPAPDGPDHDYESVDEQVFPDMSVYKNVSYGARSGTITIGRTQDGGFVVAED